MHPAAAWHPVRAAAAQDAVGHYSQRANADDGQGARELTQRQQKRRERGVARAQQRRDRQQQQLQQQSQQQQQQQPQAGQPPTHAAEAAPDSAYSSSSTKRDDHDSAETSTLAPVAGEQHVSPMRHKLVPRVLQLQQQKQSAVGKRGSPATPSKASVADKVSPGSGRQDQKHLAVHVPDECEESLPIHH